MDKKELKELTDNNKVNYLSHKQSKNIEIVSYSIEFEDEDVDMNRHAELILAKVIEVFDSRQEQLFTEQKRELSVCHRYVYVKSFNRHLDSVLARAQELDCYVHIANLTYDTQRVLDKFSQQTTITLFITKDTSDLCEITTVHDFVETKDEDFNRLIEEGFQKVDSYNLKRKLLQHMNEVTTINETEEEQEDDVTYKLWWCNL